MRQNLGQMHWAEFCLKIAKWIKKMSREPTSANYWVIKGWFFLFMGCTIPLWYAFCLSAKKKKKKARNRRLIQYLPFGQCLLHCIHSAVVEKRALLVSAYRKDIRCVHYHMAGWGFLQPHKQRGSVFCDYLFNFPLGLRQTQLRPLSSRFQSR